MNQSRTAVEVLEMRARLTFCKPGIPTPRANLPNLLFSSVNSVGASPRILTALRTLVHLSVILWVTGHFRCHLLSTTPNFQATELTNALALTKMYHSYSSYTFWF